MNNIENITQQLSAVMNELLVNHPVNKGNIFVIGCSSSEVAGGSIGKNSSGEIGQAIFETAYKICKEYGLYPAFQCCEHLNRCLVIEAQCAERFDYEPVSVVPWLHGGGSLATAAYHGMQNAVIVEHIKAAAGIDIGDTLIGMHLKDVAVPVHPSISQIGEAHVVAAFCRPKLVGGERARYN